MTAIVTCLVLPGWMDSDATHWQSHWLSRFPGTEKLVQDSFLNPDLYAWVAALDDRLKAKQADELIVLAAHSMGCWLVARWAELFPDSHYLVHAALLVAPPDLNAKSTPKVLKGFLPLPRLNLMFPTRVLGSQNDRFDPDGYAVSFAEHLGASYDSVGMKNHVSAKSEFGDDAEHSEWFNRLKTGFS